MDNFHKAILSLLTTAIIGLFCWIWAAQQRINRMEWQSAQADAGIERDKRHDASIRKHWRLQHWNFKQLNTLRVKQGLEIESWPTLGDLDEDE